MNPRIDPRPILFALLLPVAGVLLPSGGAQAGDFGRGEPSCEDLWYERNAIYADKGYCFETQRARQTFGRGCFPPYGQLSPHEKRRVERIQRLESRLGCR